MSFDNFTPRLKQVAESGLTFCKNHFGRNGLRVELEIDQRIAWKPTFYLRPTRSLILAAEVDEVLYPRILKIAAHDIRNYSHPVQVLVICPLEVYLADQRQTSVRQLRRDGFGIVTVDDQGAAIQQAACVTVAQNISEDQLESEMRELTSKLKVRFRSALKTYQVKEGQGLQEAGQIVEAIVNSIAKQSVKRGFGTSLLKNAAANTIDALYQVNEFKDHRAALGGARSFVKRFRNVSSHPSKKPADAIDKIRKCRTGFLESVEIAAGLQAAMKATGLVTQIYD